MPGVSEDQRFLRRRAMVQRTKKHPTTMVKPAGSCHLSIALNPFSLACQVRMRVRTTFIRKAAASPCSEGRAGGHLHGSVDRSAPGQCRAPVEPRLVGIRRRLRRRGARLAGGELGPGPHRRRVVGTPRPRRLVGAVFVDRFGGAFEANKLFTGILAIPLAVPLVFGLLMRRPDWQD